MKKKNRLLKSNKFLLNLENSNKNNYSTSTTWHPLMCECMIFTEKIMIPMPEGKSLENYQRKHNKFTDTSLSIQNKTPS